MGTYLVFEGIRDIGRLLKAVFNLTDLDVLYAPGVLGVRLESESDADPFFEDPEILDMDDSPEGFWSMSVEDDDYFLDRCEESMHRHGRLRGKKRDL
ncbi:MAG: hypothetical protein MJZ21_05010 [archaeon]|nr:hypothetical protein [archaeon]